MINELDVPFESIRHLDGALDQAPFDRGTYAARISIVGGAALRQASLAMIE